jgi:hypothetical protein
MVAVGQVSLKVLQLVVVSEEMEVPMPVLVLASVSLGVLKLAVELEEILVVAAMFTQAQVFPEQDLLAGMQMLLDQELLTQVLELVSMLVKAVVLMEVWETMQMSVAMLVQAALLEVTPV